MFSSSKKDDRASGSLSADEMKQFTSGAGIPDNAGLAVMSYLYAIKDGCPHQPLFAGSKESLQKLYTEMLKVSAG